MGLVPTGSAQATDFPFVNVSVQVYECDGVSPIHGAYVEIQFDNGTAWNFLTDEHGQVNEVIAPGDYTRWRLGVNGVWGQWDTGNWAKVTVNGCWVHLPLVEKGE